MNRLSSRSHAREIGNDDGALIKVELPIPEIKETKPKKVLQRLDNSEGILSVIVRRNPKGKKRRQKKKPK